MKNNLNMTKDFITGVFQMNAELKEIDDSIFITILRHAIESASNEKDIQDELLNHSQNLYIAEWLKYALEAEGANYNEEKEITDAIEKFTEYYSNPLRRGTKSYN